MPRPPAQAGGGLIVNLDERKAGVPASAEAAAAQWFSQDLFADENLEDGDEEPAVPQQAQRGARGRQPVAAAPAPESDGEGSEGREADANGAAALSDGGSSSAGEEEGAQQSQQGGESSDEDAVPRPLRKSKRGAAAGGGGAAGEGEFEVVPLKGSGSEDSSSDEGSEDEFENLDDSAKVGVHTFVHVTGRGCQSGGGGDVVWWWW